MMPSSLNPKLLKSILENFGKSYAEELGIKLATKKSSEIFKWFLASILFGARISETCAKNTYLTFKKYKLLTPQTIIKAGRRFLIDRVMAEGGYARYDNRTSDKIIAISQELIDRYDGALNKLYAQAKNQLDLEQKLLSFKGIGPVTLAIFLREMRQVWPKAKPPLTDWVKLAANKFKIKDIYAYWQKNKVKSFSFINFETALFSIGKILTRKRKKQLQLLENTLSANKHVHRC